MKCKNKNTIDEVVLAIQIEGNQYRKGASLIGKDITVEDVYKKFKEYGWFNEYTYNKNVQNKIFDQDTIMKLSYCKYENDKTNPYHFVYQYFNLNSDDKKLDKIKELIKKDLNLMKKIIENNLKN